jgi:hypothetical protein
MKPAKLDMVLEDTLFRIERRIAQRADQLSAGRPLDRDAALAHWRQAEREVWEGSDQLLDLTSIISPHERVRDDRPFVSSSATPREAPPLRTTDKRAPA